METDNATIKYTVKVDSRKIAREKASETNLSSTVGARQVPPMLDDDEKASCQGIKRQWEREGIRIVATDETLLH